MADEQKPAPPVAIAAGTVEVTRGAGGEARIWGLSIKEWLNFGFIIVFACIFWMQLTRLNDFIRETLTQQQIHSAETIVKVQSAQEASAKEMVRAQEKTVQAIEKSSTDMTREQGRQADEIRRNTDALKDNTSQQKLLLEKIDGKISLHSSGEGNGVDNVPDASQDGTSHQDG